MRIKINKQYRHGKNNNPNNWIVEFFPYLTNADATTINIVSLEPQVIKIENGLINNTFQEVILTPNAATNVISFTFKATGKGRLIFSNKDAIIGLGRLILNTPTATHIFSNGTINSPCIVLDLQDLPSNLQMFILDFNGHNDSRTYIKQSYNELVNYSQLKGIVLGNPSYYPNFNYTSFSFNYEKPLSLSFVYIENVYTEKKLNGNLTQSTAPVNDNFFINPIITKNAGEFIFFCATANINTDNKNVVKGKLKDFGTKPFHIEWFNSSLIEGKISDMKMQDIKILSIGGTNIKGYDEGVVFNDLVTNIDISRTGMTDLDTDKFLIDLKNSITTNQARTVKIKHRTSATDSIVTALSSKGVVLSLG